MHKSLVRKIKDIVGTLNTSTDAEDLVCYAYDGSTEAVLPDVIVHPASASEISSLLEVASEAGIPVVARGAGTGLSGGSVPLAGGLVLHLDRMNRLKLLDPAEMMAVAEPGITNWELRRRVAAEGLFYPPDPGSTKVCTLGGNVAENAGGPSSSKYGATGDYVIGLEAVLASGSIVRTGGNTRRNVAGYDLTSLLVGSEGTLAVITEVTVRLLPRPQARGTAIMAFEDIADAGAAVTAIGAWGVFPAALEVMDKTTIECVERFRPGILPVRVSAVLLIEVDGETGSVDHQIQAVIDACESCGGNLLRRAHDDAEAEEIWESRRSISAALGRIAPSRIGEDICVPRARVPEMLEIIQRIGKKHDLMIAVFGHVGDGILHPNILTDRRDPKMMKRTSAAIGEVFEAAVDLGGTISGEHGIGIAKSPWLRRAVSGEVLALMKMIKDGFDPKGILNPGKIF